MTTKAPSRLARRREDLLRQASLVEGGVAYVYDVASARSIGRSKLPPNLLELLGFSAGMNQPAGAERLDDLAHPDDRDQAPKHYDRLAGLDDGVFATVVFRMKHADGSWRWIEVRERVFSRTRAGAVRRVLGFASDITERRRLLESLAGATGALLLAEEHERRRIARELHDSTTQHLVAIDLTVSRLERRIGDDPIDRGIVRDIRAALSAAHQEIRTFAYLLHPPQLEQVGLEAALDQFLSGFERRTGLAVRFQMEGPDRRLGQHAELALFRVAQEALMNVHRHANAREVDIRLRHLKTETVLEIADDGRGLPEREVGRLLATPAPGVGIASMQARVADLGGLLEISTQVGGGLLIRAVMPRRRKSDAPVHPQADGRPRVVRARDEITARTA